MSAPEQNFWSRRRAAVRAEEAQEQASMEAAALAEEQAAHEEKSDVELLAELDLPDPDTLKEGDDFSAFMAKAVPDRIRRRALRTLWRSNPVLANVDGLVDYGQDFTDSAMVVENMQTAYQVGKGMLKHVEEMARQAAEAETPAEPEVEEDVEREDVLAEAEQETEIEKVMEPDADDGEVEHVQMAEVAALPPSPRRMTFRTEQTA